MAVVLLVSLEVVLLDVAVFREAYCWIAMRSVGGYIKLF